MEELDLKELLQLFCEKIVQIILIIAVFVVIGIVYTIGFVTPKYRSSTSLILATNNSANVTGQNGITTNDLTLNSKLVSTYSTLAKSKKVVRAVLSNLGLDGNLEDSVRKNISVSTVSTVSGWPLPVMMALYSSTCVPARRRTPCLEPPLPTRIRFFNGGCAMGLA